jgi:hypothetical protein
LNSGGTSHGHATSSGVASNATFGLTLVAWNGYGVRLVVARETGVIKRWRATSLGPWAGSLSSSR